MSYSQFFAGMGMGLLIIALLMISRSIAITWLVRKKTDLIDRVCGIIEDESLDNEGRIHAYNKAGVKHPALITIAENKIRRGNTEDAKKRRFYGDGRFRRGGTERDAGRGRGEETEQIEAETSGESQATERREPDKKGFFPRSESEQQRSPVKNGGGYERKWSIQD